MDGNGVTQEFAESKLIPLLPMEVFNTIMGFDIHLQDERGKVQATISDPKNLLHRLLERSFVDEPLLMEIDWYGDTVFNRLEIPRFLSQWKILATHCKTPEEATIVDDVKALAIKCKEAVHLYLKFEGD